MIRSKIIYPAQAKNITVYDTDGNIFYFSNSYTGIEMDVNVCVVGSLFSDFIRHAEEFERRGNS